MVNASELRAKAEELLAQADRIESQHCTGLSARWCPLHGDCSCPEPEDSLDDPSCPLHDWKSSHAATQEVAGADLANVCGPLLELGAKS